MFQTVLKITASRLSSQTFSKSNSMSGVHKCISRVSIPYKRLEDVSISSLSKYATSDISAEQPHQKEVASSSNGSLDIPECSIARRKSDRRKSFTCLLMARSKVGVKSMFFQINHFFSVLFFIHRALDSWHEWTASQGAMWKCKAGKFVKHLW